MSGGFGAERRCGRAARAAVGRAGEQAAATAPGAARHWLHAFRGYFGPGRLRTVRVVTRIDAGAPTCISVRQRRRQQQRKPPLSVSRAYAAPRRLLGEAAASMASVKAHFPASSGKAADPLSKGKGKAGGARRGAARGARECGAMRPARG